LFSASSPIAAINRWYIPAQPVPQRLLGHAEFARGLTLIAVAAGERLIDEAPLEVPKHLGEGLPAVKPKSSALTMSLRTASV